MASSCSSHVQAAQERQGRLWAQGLPPPASGSGMPPNRVGSGWCPVCVSNH
jgi:hypothetical protein